jgi:hypothetical protein
MMFVPVAVEVIVNLLLFFILFLIFHWCKFSFGLVRRVQQHGTTCCCQLCVAVEVCCIQKRGKTILVFLRCRVYALMF